jgi:hypothetical protein
MHCELVVPGLFRSSNLPRFPALELLLARGRRQSYEAQPLEQWAREAFELGDGPFPAGALTLRAHGRDPGAAPWVRADPVHLRLMRDRAVVAPGEAFEISSQEATALCDALNEHFGNLEFTTVDARRWCARIDAPVEERPALYAAGEEADVRPEVAALLTEAQMVLHAHPVNEAREARGAPAVNSVWCWGAGRVDSAHCVWQSVASDDPALIGAARLAGARQRPLPRSAMEWIERLPEDGRHLAVLDAVRVALALDEDVNEKIAAFERDWFAPLLAALRAGRIGMVSLHAPDGAHALSFETIRGDLRRFWRLPKNIERYA